MFRSYSSPLLILLCCSLLSWGQTVRGKKRGTFNIPSSNVAGNGNITAGALLSGGYGKTDSELIPRSMQQLEYPKLCSLAAGHLSPIFRTRFN